MFPTENTYRSVFSLRTGHQMVAAHIKLKTEFFLLLIHQRPTNSVSTHMTHQPVF